MSAPPPRRIDAKLQLRLLKGAAWIGGLVPLCWLTYRLTAGDALGADPVAALELWSGRSGLTLLMVTLAITPIRIVTKWNRVIQVRRTLGLFAFSYVTLHFLFYLVLDQFFGWDFIVEDIAERPFITVGFAAWVIMIPLAVTSTKGWIRRLGKRWTLLHKLVYFAGGLAVLHYYWNQKADTRVPLLVAWILALLLGVRLFNRARKAWARR